MSATEAAGATSFGPSVGPGVETGAGLGLWLAIGIAPGIGLGVELVPEASTTFACGVCPKPEAGNRKDAVKRGMNNERRYDCIVRFSGLMPARVPSLSLCIRLGLKRGI